MSSSDSSSGLHHHRGGSHSGSSYCSGDDIVHVGHHHHHHHGASSVSGPDAKFKTRRSGIQSVFIAVVFVVLLGAAYSTYRRNQELQRRILVLSMANATLAEKVKTLESAAAKKTGEQDSYGGFSE